MTIAGNCSCCEFTIVISISCPEKAHPGERGHFTSTVLHLNKIYFDSLNLYVQFIIFNFFSTQKSLQVHIPANVLKLLCAKTTKEGIQTVHLMIIFIFVYDTNQS